MNSRKAYVIDPALCHRLGFSFSENSGRILENIVLVDLLRRGAEVYYHKDKKECDFVVRSGLTITTAIQVCENLHIENYSRELEGLLDAIRCYGLEKGLLICNHNTLQENLMPSNIQIISASEWLLTN